MTLVLIGAWDPTCMQPRDLTLTLTLTQNKPMTLGCAGDFLTTEPPARAPRCLSVAFRPRGCWEEEEESSRTQAFPAAGAASGTPTAGTRAAGRPGGGPSRLCNHPPRLECLLEASGCLHLVHQPPSAAPIRAATRLPARDPRQEPPAEGEDGAAALIRPTQRALSHTGSQRSVPDLLMPGEAWQGHAFTGHSSTAAAQGTAVTGSAHTGQGPWHPP